MLARANNRTPTALWAVALATFAPGALAHAAPTTSDLGEGATRTLKSGPAVSSWKVLVDAQSGGGRSGVSVLALLSEPHGAPLVSIAAFAPAAPLADAGFDPMMGQTAAAAFAHAAAVAAPGIWLDASPHALAVRHGAPLQTLAAVVPDDEQNLIDIAEAIAAETGQPAPVQLRPAPSTQGSAADAPVVLRPAAAPDAAPAAPFVQEAAASVPEAAPAAAVAPMSDAAPKLPPVTLHAVNAVEGPLVALDADEAAGGADPLAPQAVDPPQSRRRPGAPRGQAPIAPSIAIPPTDPNAVAPAASGDIEQCEEIAGGVDPAQNTKCAPPIPDRWRLIENLGIVKEKWWDPYNQNTLKGDRPILGTQDWFLNLSAVSDTIIEPRSFPVPVGVQTTSRAGSNDLFGDPNALVLAQTFIVGASLVKGSTAFKPQELEIRAALAWNVNYAEVEEKRILNVRPDAGVTRNDSFVGVQEAFIEKHLRNVTDRYDFDSLRVGIQPFSTDFRGFLFQDNQLGVRLFGTRNNNRFQYNLAAFWRLEKDTNSGLNDVGVEPRKDYVFIANAFRQDTPIPGFTSQITAVYNANREADDIHVDKNGFPVRPALIGNLRGREYDVGYVGYNGDGHLGRVNLTASAYYAFGKDRNNIFTGKESVIRSYFVAVEPSIDFNWIRVRGSALLASGDDNPYDDRETGFDAIQENPQFAGSDTSYWIRQSVPFIGGGRVIGLSGRNGILNSLRSSKDEGQSNFINPGLKLLGVGADFDVTPKLRVSTNVNHLDFDTTEVLQALRVEGSIPEEIGWDVSGAAIYRPGFIQNFVFRLSAAALLPGDGFKDLFSNKDKKDYYYSVLFNATLSY